MSVTDPQPAPQNVGEPIVPMVIADLQARREFGRRKYGDELRVRNGRDALVDAYQEALDLCIYLRQRIEQEKPVTRWRCNDCGREGMTKEQAMQHREYVGADVVEYAQ